jgi:DNA gyrase subunit A
VAEVVLNNLFQHTQLQSVFGINMVALRDGQPQLLNLKQLLEAFIQHRREVVTRRTVFELRKARERAHLLEGLAVALANIDAVIALIKASASPADAKRALLDRAWESGLVNELLARAGDGLTRPDGLDERCGLQASGYWLSEQQAQAILDLRLHRLTGLEKDKIVNEYKEIVDKIQELGMILASPIRLMEVIREELVDLRERYADARRTEIIADHLDLSLEDLITEEDMVVTLSHAGYAKIQSLDHYQAQRRGGRGKSATRMKDEDFIDRLFIANTHDTILCFSSHGRVYWLKVYELPQASRTARGKPIVNLLPLGEGERINTILPVRDFGGDQYVFLATRNGTVKKTPLADFSRPRATGIIAIDLAGDDVLVNAALTDGQREVMLLTSAGKAIRFRESEVRSMGRVARGVRGIRLAGGQQVIALLIVDSGSILTATAHGFGKCTPVAEYPLKGRGGQGVISIRTSERNGEVVGAVQVDDGDEVMLISNVGALVRTPVTGISVMSRNTQGVTLMSLGEGERLVGLEKLAQLSNGDAPLEDADDDAGEVPADPAA